MGASLSSSGRGAAGTTATPSRPLASEGSTSERTGDISLPPTTTALTLWQPQRKRRKKDSDCVYINVGGGVFFASKTTLAMRSSYFASKFKAEWDSDSESEPLFVDQDPAAFAVLLDFMREGFIKAFQLTEKVLVQAEFFGIDDLLTAVKAVALRAKYPAKRHLSDDKACEQFDMAFGGVLGAIRQGILPKEIRQIVQFPHEVAVLCSHHRTVRIEGIWPSRLKRWYVTVKVRSGIVEDATGDEGKMVAVPTCSTFVNALNWLDKESFIQAPKDLEDFDIDEPADIRLKKFFLRPVPTGNNPIVFEIPSNNHYRRAFATMFAPSPNGPCLVIVDDGSDAAAKMVFNDDPETAAPTTTSSTSKLFNSESDARDWLHSHGYTANERDLLAKLAPDAKFHLFWRRIGG